MPKPTPIKQACSQGFTGTRSRNARELSWRSVCSATRDLRF
ncbi:hypothetical protein [Coleofasciculus sp. FACHB-1120]|nr:hypothetical protein [Coleofasciculus sp. FACHB-1120]